MVSQTTRARPVEDLIIADDDQALREMLGHAFKTDFKVHLARDGSEALRLLERVKPVAVLVDEMMPGATGTEVLEHAKQRHPNVPRILMTASHDPERAVTAVNRGEIHRFYTKPLRVVEVRKAVLALVEQAKGAELLRVELATLERIRHESAASRETARVVILGAHDAHGDQVAEACKVRGFSVRREGKPDHMPQALMQSNADVVVLLREKGVDVGALANLAHSLDESCAIVIIDVAPNLGAALEALELGAVDYLPAPLPEVSTLAARLERAVARPRAQRDLRRLTYELIVANRDLADARRRAEQEQIKVLNAMIRALEARDSYTAGHTDRVALIAVRTGEVLGLAPERLDIIRVGALLHDIGKIGIRDTVLLKPDRLTPEEFEVIKTHTQIGASLLADIDQFKCVIPMVRNHHERMDGSGYPDGLAGEQIPQEVRVVSAADVLDAITSTRPYRRGSTPEFAFEILEREAPKHLDLNVVNALKQVHKEGRLVELLQPNGAEGEGPGPY